MRLSTDYAQDVVQCLRAAQRVVLLEAEFGATVAVDLVLDAQEGRTDGHDELAHLARPSDCSQVLFDDTVDVAFVVSEVLEHQRCRLGCLSFNVVSKYQPDHFLSECKEQLETKKLRVLLSTGMPLLSFPRVLVVSNKTNKIIVLSGVKINRNS